MPILRICTSQDQTRLADGRAAQPALHAALAATQGPVTILLHGFKYAPGSPLHCPFERLFSQTPTPGGTSWPRRLGLRGQSGEGLGIGFGWPARGSLWRAYARAEEAGCALARMLDDLHAASPERKVHLFAHSMGARVAFSALRHGRAASVQKVILLAAAEFAAPARAALLSPGGARAEILNVTSRENDLFDFLLEQILRPGPDAGRALGAAIDLPQRLVTLQLDDPGTLRLLRSAGFPIAPPQRRICHWSPYTRPGVFPLYRAIFDGRMPISTLRAMLPEEQAPRWTRLSPTLRPRRFA